MSIFDINGNELVVTDKFKSNWIGKKITFDGTSLMSEHFGFASKICEILGATPDNHAQSGVQTFINSRKTIQEYAPDTDAIVIEIDGNGTPNGSIGDLTEDSWIGRANIALNNLREAFPTIPIFLVSDWGTRKVVTINGGKRMVLLSDTVRQLSAFHGCIHIDCSALSQFNMVNAKSCNAFSNTGSDDHQKKELAEKYLYPYIANRINDYIPLDEPPETGITLSETNVTVKVGEIVTLSATILPDRTVWNTNQWKSADTSIATACGGEIKGVSVGETTVTVTTKHGYKATCTVTVTSD